MTNASRKPRVDPLVPTRQVDWKQPCCISFCGEAATHKAGRSIQFPLCDAHFEQLS